MKPTPELIKHHITLVSTLSDEELAHHYKCASSSESKLYKPYMLAIEKERKARNKKPLKDPHETEEIPEVQ